MEIGPANSKDQRDISVGGVASRRNGDAFYGWMEGIDGHYDT